MKLFGGGKAEKPAKDDAKEPAGEKPAKKKKEKKGDGDGIIRPIF